MGFDQPARVERRARNNFQGLNENRQSFPADVGFKINIETNSTCHIPINGLPVGIQCYWYARRVTHPISCHKQLFTTGPLSKQKVKGPDTGPGAANPDVLFTPHLCLHENTIILTDLGQWGVGKATLCISGGISSLCSL